MTRCPEFYEKLEKDGNFCGMSEQDYKTAVDYWKGVEKDEQDKPCLSCTKWRKERIAEAKRFKEVEPEKPQYPDRKVREYDFAKEVNNFIIWCYEQREEETIREVIEKAIVNNRK